MFEEQNSRLGTLDQPDISYTPDQPFQYSASHGFVHSGGPHGRWVCAKGKYLGGVDHCLCVRADEHLYVRAKRVCLNKDIILWPQMRRKTNTESFPSERDICLFTLSGCNCNWKFKLNKSIDSI